MYRLSSAGSSKQGPGATTLDMVHHTGTPLCVASALHSPLTHHSTLPLHITPLALHITLLALHITPLSPAHHSTRPAHHSRTCLYDFLCSNSLAHTRTRNPAVLL